MGVEKIDGTVINAEEVIERIKDLTSPTAQYKHKFCVDIVEEYCMSHDCEECIVNQIVEVVRSGGKASRQNCYNFMFDIDEIVYVLRDKPVECKVISMLANRTGISYFLMEKECDGLYPMTYLADDTNIGITVFKTKREAEEAINA